MSWAVPAHLGITPDKIAGVSFPVPKRDGCGRLPYPNSGHRCPTIGTSLGRRVGGTFPMKDHNWKLKPFPHQWASYKKTRDQINHALFWDQGLGKTALCIATVAHLFRTDKIDGVLIIAPGGVESNWTNDEIPDHLPDEIDRECFFWSSPKSTTKKFKESFEAFMEVKELKILAMSYDAMMTDRGAKAAKKFLTENRVFYIVDESTRIKTPDAKTTKRVVASRRYARYRRALNGTPVEDSPFALYTQIKFVDPHIWTALGINTYTQFKSFFGEFRSMQYGSGKAFPELVKYRNLDILNKALHEAGERLLKEDHLDLPPKVYQKRRFELSPKQRRLYKELKEHYTLMLDSGEPMDAEMAIVRLIRFQQICSGYLPKGEDDAELVEIEPGKNPRIKLLASVLEDTSGSAIIWAKYNKDVDAIVELLTKRGESFVTYDGRTSPEDREKAKRDFQSGKVRFFVAKPQAAGRGLTLTAATTVVYYNNGFSADLRKQSEDRAHRIGQTKTVVYVDLLATDTVDEHILSVLRKKREMSSIVTGDQLGKWI